MKQTLLKCHIQLQLIMQLHRYKNIKHSYTPKKNKSAESPSLFGFSGLRRWPIGCPAMLQPFRWPQRSADGSDGSEEGDGFEG